MNVLVISSTVATADMTLMSRPLCWYLHRWEIKFNQSITLSVYQSLSFHVRVLVFGVLGTEGDQLQRQFYLFIVDCLNCDGCSPVSLTLSRRLTVRYALIARVLLLSVWMRFLYFFVFTEVSKHYNSKVSLEHQLPTATQKLKTTDECVVSSLISLVTSTGKVGGGFTHTLSVVCMFAGFVW